MNCIDVKLGALCPHRGGVGLPRSTDWLLEFAGEKEEGFKLPIFFADVI